MTDTDPLWRRAPRVFLLAKVCFAFPVLIYGVDRADYLISYQVDGLDLAVIALSIAFLPGLALCALEALLTRLLSRSAHRGLMLTLLAAATWQIATWGLVLTGWAGIVAAVVATALGFRYLGVVPRSRGEAAVLMLLCLGLPLWLVFGSELAVLARTPPPPPPAGTIARRRPVVLALFDGLPLPALLDGAGAIDPALYPNFAKLAGTSTFFRNATANHGYTNVSIPSLLSGRLPARLRVPVAAEYPETLFRLLAGAYRFRVTESGTRLCPENLAGTVRVQASRLDRWGAVGYDLLQVLPMIFAGSLNDRQLGDLVQRLRFFGMERARKRDEDAYDRAGLFLRYLDGIETGASDTVYYAHVGLPHDPWDHTHDGARYRVPAESQGILLAMTNPQHLYFYWTRDLWTVQQSYQRLLFQVMYTDHLLGLMVERLKKARLWDDALVIVTSDHGSAVAPGNFPRDIVLPQSPLVKEGKLHPNHVEVLAVPMFVKVPGQTAGSVSDRNVELIDVLPTIAAVLGVTIPWPVDGRTVLDLAAPERPSKTFFDYDFTKIELPALLPGREEPLKKRAEWFDPAPAGDWVWRLKPAGHLVGQPPPPGAAWPFGATCELDAGQPPGVLTGTVRGPGLGTARHLVLVRVGRVTAVTRLHQSGRFLAFERPADRGAGPLTPYLLAKGDGSSTTARYGRDGTEPRQGSSITTSLGPAGSGAGRPSQP